MSCRQIKLRGLSFGLEDGVLQKVVQDNSSSFILGHCHYNLPYSTFLAPCALNFFRVAANF